MLTQVVVDAGDPAFAHPTKTDRPGLPAEGAERLDLERGSAIRRDGERLPPRGRRRRSHGIVELSTRSELLVDTGVMSSAPAAAASPWSTTGRNAARRRGRDRQGPRGGAARPGASRPTSCSCSPTSTPSTRLGHAGCRADRTATPSELRVASSSRTARSVRRWRRPAAFVEATGEDGRDRGAGGCCGASWREVAGIRRARGSA